MSDYDIQDVFDEIAKFTPKTGFNLCSIDNHATPGEHLALIGHFDTIEEAEKAQEEYGKDNSVIYSAKKN